MLLMNFEFMSCCLVFLGILDLELFKGIGDIEPSKGVVESLELFTLIMKAFSPSCSQEGGTAVAEHNATNGFSIYI